MLTNLFLLCFQIFKHLLFCKYVHISILACLAFWLKRYSDKEVVNALPTTTFTTLGLAACMAICFDMAECTLFTYTYTNDQVYECKLYDTTSYTLTSSNYWSTVYERICTSGKITKSCTFTII